MIKECTPQPPQTIHRFSPGRVFWPPEAIFKRANATQAYSRLNSNFLNVTQQHIIRNYFLLIFFINNPLTEITPNKRYVDQGILQPQVKIKRKFETLKRKFPMSSIYEDPQFSELIFFTTC